MERARRLKIYQFVVLMGTTNWKIYRDTAHCRKKIFFQAKKLQFFKFFKGVQIEKVQFSPGHITVNKKLLRQTNS